MVPLVGADVTGAVGAAAAGSAGAVARAVVGSVAGGAAAGSVAGGVCVALSCVCMVSGSAGGGVVVSCAKAGTDKASALAARNANFMSFLLRPVGDWAAGLFVKQCACRTAARGLDNARFAGRFNRLRNDCGQAVPS